MIRSTKIYNIPHMNSSKLFQLEDFLDLYYSDLINCIDFIWNNIFYDKDNKVIWDINNDIYDLPKFLDYNKIDWKDSKLSARCKASVLAQAVGIIKGTVGKRKAILDKIDYFKSNNKSIEKYQKALSNVSKPIISKDRFSAELSANHIDFKKSSGCFDYWIRIRSLNFPFIYLPIKLSKMDKKWIRKGGKLLNNILISKNCIQLRYELPDKKRTEGKIVGCDTGVRTLITLSNQNSPNSVDNHGHTLESIQKRLSGKKKGSKSFNRTQKHRTNYIHWYINNLNFRDIKQINLENVCFSGQSKTRYLTHWVYGEIKKRLEEKCEEHGVHLNLHDSNYYSQRCCKCGLVLKSNRKGKVYKCKCGNNLDADLNSSLNHELELPFIPFEIRKKRLNIIGFLWKEEGIFNYDGQELILS